MQQKNYDDRVSDREPAFLTPSEKCALGFVDAIDSGAIPWLDSFFLEHENQERRDHCGAKRALPSNFSEIPIPRVAIVETCA